MSDHERTYEQLRRVLLVASLLAPLRRGATAAELVEDVRALSGRDWRERTIRRDLHTLEAVGVVQRYRGPGRGPGPEAFFWRWRGLGIRSAAIERAAELAEMAADVEGDREPAVV